MKAKSIIFGLIALMFVSCQGYFSDMNIPNEYEPDIAVVMGDVNQYPALVKGLYKSYWDAMTDYNCEPLFVVGTNADIFCPGAGNWSMRDYTYSQAEFEKPEINNADASSEFPKSRWYAMYSMIGTLRSMLSTIKTNDLKYFESGADMTDKILANLYFLYGLVYSEMALMFDKCFVITEETDISTISVDDIKPASEVCALAISYFDKCLELCKKTSFTNFVNCWPNEAVATSADLERCANFFAARLLAYMPRDNFKDVQPDWNKILTYAEKGLEKDIKASLPGESTFGDIWTQAMAGYYNTGWMRASMRLIKMMAPEDANAVWPTPKSYSFAVNGAFPEVTNCPDARLNTYFVYSNSPSGPANGLDFTTSCSTYAFNLENRFCMANQPSGEGDVYLFNKTESDLILAEAYLNTGNLAKAAELVNLTHEGIGHMTDVMSSSSKEKILRGIYYEMFLEACWGNSFNGWYNRRRTPIDEFQLTTRSFRELPIPRVELDFYGLEGYTFGGTYEAEREKPSYKF